jgi:hypothetical protein
VDQVVAKEGADVLIQRCVRCHGGEKPKGKLDLTTRKAAVAGGASGPGLDPAAPLESLLWERVAAGEMPPSTPLNESERAAIRAWLNAGMRYPHEPLQPPRAGLDWWSLQPLADPPIPQVKQQNRVRNPIDAFILHRLETEGLSPAPEADRLTLLRRLSLDLTGLPPTPEETERFLSDPRPDAYEREVDRLLASPAHGERWASHWLDVVRFGESHGYETNQLRPNAWPYRDWVIRAFNQDLPWNQFVQAQFTGDMFKGVDGLTEAATGFLVGGTHDVVGNQTEAGMRQQRADDLDDLIAATGTAFLGFSVQCARCHDHKFDPITQRDYYGLAAIFAGVEHSDREIPAPDREMREKRREELAQAVERLTAEMDAREPLTGPGAPPARRLPVHSRGNTEKIRPIAARVLRMTVTATTDGTEPCIDEIEVWTPGPERRNVALAAAGTTAKASSVYPNSEIHRLEHINDGKYGNGRSWISAEPGKGWVELTFSEPATIERITWARDREGAFSDRLAKDYRFEIAQEPDGAWTVIADSADRVSVGAELSAELTELRKQLEVKQAELAATGATMKAYCGRFKNPPEPTYLLLRGDPMRRGERVPPAVPKFVGVESSLAADSPEPARRALLAAALGDPAHGLIARVAVNRLWQQHYGQGIVATPGDFGYQGERPSHPELLEWLACRFREAGGSLKPIHRLIVTSATYRQSAQGDPRTIEQDSANRWLGRWLPRRLEAESIRDAMLATSGSLRRTMGGPGYSLWEKNSNYVVVFTPLANPGPETFRRMIYQFKPRSQPDPVFGAFDCPDGSLVAPRRNRSVTPLQALNLWNSPFVLSQSEALAARVERAAGPQPDAQIQEAFRLVLGRPPRVSEAAAARALAASHGLPAVARALYNTSEFQTMP